MKKSIIGIALVVLSVLMLSLPVLAVVEGVSYGDVPKWNEAITIDGTKDAAYDHALKLHQSRKHYEAEPETSTNGDSYILWADGFIYVYGEITDAAVVATNEDIGSNTPWMADSLEVFLDPGNDGVDPMQYRIDYTGRPSFQFTDLNSYGQDASAANGIFEYSAVKTATGYSVEFKIPFTSTKIGEKIGLQLQINDMADDVTRTCVFPPNSLGGGSWDVTMYDYIVLADAPVIATEAPAAPADDAPVAPQTGDNGLVLCGALLLIAILASARLTKHKG
ncbi:MAG: sugar-binding protein [Eubacteriales bacterium]